MPLFMCLSGFLYAKLTKISNIEEYGLFIKKKFINLSIPYLVFYVAYVGINMIFASSVNSQKGMNDLLNIFTEPMPPFWFLYALFFIFLIVPIIEKIFKNNYNFVFGIFIILHILEIFIHTPIYAINIVCEYGVYFYLGKIIFNNVNKIFNNKRKVVLNILAFIILGVVYSFILEKQIIDYKLMNILKFMLAILGTVASMQLFKILENKFVHIKIINYMDKYTFPIYLMHTMFSACIRIVLLKVGIFNFYIHFILGLLFGMLGPTIVAIILKKSKYGEIVLYPLNTIKKMKMESLK